MMATPYVRFFLQEWLFSVITHIHEIHHSGCKIDQYCTTKENMATPYVRAVQTENLLANPSPQEKSRSLYN